jgi:hypothetical protein
MSIDREIAIRVLKLCLVGAVLTAAAATAGSARAAASGQKITLYAYGTRAEFLNNADDRQRAIINNPFTTNTAKLMEVMRGKEKETGPLPGDSMMYSFDLYKGADLKTKLGAAVYTCDYGFKSVGICQAYFQTSDGTLLASGPITFKDLVATKYELSVRGGTKSFLGARGDLQVVPAKTAGRLSFVLLVR